MSAFSTALCSLRSVQASAGGWTERVLYINRDPDRARLVAIEHELQRVGLEGERVAGIDGLAVPEAFRELFFTGETQHSQLTPGEVGCYASHLVAMKSIVDRKTPYALVLEDDAVLPTGLHEAIEQILAALPDDWDIVHLCKDPSRAIKPVAQLDGRQLVRYSRVPETTTAYLVSISGAEKFLIPTKRYWPVDTDFRQPWKFGLQVYGVVPRLVKASDSFPSIIHEMGDHSRLRRGVRLPTRYCLTGNPLHTPQGAWFNLHALGLGSWLTCSIRNGLRRIVPSGTMRSVRA